MLEAVSKGFLSRTVQLSETDKLMGELDMHAFRERGRLELEEGTYQLSREGDYRGDFFRVFDGERQIGSIYTTGFLERRSHVDLPADIPLPQRAFLLWLVLIIWKRQNQAAAS